MTAASTSPAPAPNRPTAPTPPRGGRPAAPTIDPVRILRQHLKLLGAAAIGGILLGTVLNYVFLFVYPLWGGSVIFEIRPEVTGAKDAVTREIVQDEAIARLGQTESAKMVSKSVLEAAMKAPDIGTTKWGQYYTSVDERVKELEDTLRVGHRRGTQLFTMSWRTWEKTDVPVVLNRVAAAYMTARNEEENERAATSKGKFESKKSQVEEEIRSIKAEIQDFIRSKGITAGREADLADQRSTENLARLRDDTIRDLTLAQARLDQVDRKIADQRFEDEDRRQALEDVSIRSLERDLQQIQVALNSARESFGPDHPQIKDLSQREVAGRARLKAAMDEAMSRNLLADKIDLSQRVQGLKSLVEKQTADLAEAQKKLQDLTAQISGLDALKEQLEQKQLERADLQNLIVQIDLLQARDDARRVRRVQDAMTPKEIDFPQLKFMMPGGAVLVLLLTVGVLFLREFLDQRVKQPSDLAGLGARLLGVIPDTSDDPAQPKRAELVVAETPGSTTAEMFRQLVAGVRKSMDASGLRSLAIVTANPGGGSTTVVSNLAASLHAIGRSVAVVDANLRRPRLASILGADPDAPGLGDLLAGRQVEPQQAHGVAVFGPGSPESRIYERLATDEMRRILARLRERYEIVIVDLPPTLVAGESMVVADCCDAAILVVRAEKDERGLVGKFIHQLQDTRAVMLGTVLMRPSHTVGGYFKKNAELMADYAKPAAEEATS
jgi:Mrp family chromosome partitioning ATPase/uncharacterized protein involved in exopolysaccharide biosynthesis